MLHLDSCHLRKGVDLYAQLLGFGGIPPHHCVVPGNAARRLKNTHVHLGHLNTGGERFDLPGVHQARGHTKSVLLWHRPPAQLGRFLADGQNEVAALGEHHIEAEFRREPFPQPHTFLEKVNPLRCRKGRADEGSVTAAGPTAEVRLVKNGEVGHPPFRQVVRQPQTVDTGTDDHRLVRSTQRSVRTRKDSLPHAFSRFLLPTTPMAAAAEVGGG